MIIYIDGKLDRDELTYDEACELSQAEVLPALLWWFTYAPRYQQTIRKAA
jgi:hypothetical protein